MSELNIYAQRLNELAQKTFAEYNETETAFNNAQETVREYPRRVGAVTPEYAAKSARAEATLLKGTALEAAQINENPHMQAFDTAVEVFKKCLNNTRLIPHWNELTSEFIENF